MTDDPTATQAAPPPPPPPPPTRERGPWAIEHFVGGDWLGAIAAALAGVLVMLALAAAIEAIDPPNGVSVGGFICRVLAIVVLAFGGSVKVATAGTLSSLSGHAVSVSIMPIFVTILGYVAMGIVFTRRLRRRTPTLPGLVQQAVRLLLVVAVLVVGISLAAHHSSDTSSPNYVRVAIFYSVVFAVCVTIAALVVMLFFGLPDVLPARARAFRDWLYPAAIGILAALAVVWVLGTVFALVQIIVEPGDLTRMTQAGLLTDTDVGRASEFASLLSMSVNHAVWLFCWGMGVPLRVSSGGLGGQNLRLTYFTDGAPGYWALLPLAILVWLAAAAITVRRAAPGNALRTALGLPALAVVLSGAIYVFAGAAAHPLHSRLTLRFHFGFWWLLLYIAVLSGVAGVVAAQLRDRRHQPRAAGTASGTPPPPPPPPTTEVSA